VATASGPASGPDALSTSDKPEAHAAWHGPRPFYPTLASRQRMIANSRCGPGFPPLVNGYHFSIYIHATRIAFYMCVLLR
jgi:hypothetical protein